MLKQDAMTPLYVQLMDTVEKDIKSGRYKPGDKIMTESEMAKTYGVSLITVRKAIGSLMEKGLVVRKQGKGTFVTKPKFSRNIKRLQSFSEMCEQMGVVPGAHMLENKIVDADEKIAARLGIETGSKVIFISRLRFADSEPVVIEKNYFPLKYAFLLEAQFEDNSLFDYLKEKKLSYQELSKYPILMLDKQSTTSEFLHRLFQQHHLDLVPEIELTSNDLLIDLARIGLGIAFIPDYCLSRQSEDLFVVETEESLPERELVIAYNEQVPLSNAAVEFLNYFN